MTSHPIGVFDSGLGGLTVLSALRGQLPQEDFFYFADTRFLPYGDRPEIFLKERGVLIAEALARRGAKALVIACNTATAAAAEAIRAATSLPIVALEPGVKPAAALTRTGVIGVLATTRTLHSERFERLVGNHANHLKVVAQPCPGLAEAIESEGPGSTVVAALLDTFVAPLAAANADVVVLGCTHYPWVAEAIAGAHAGRGDVARYRRAGGETTGAPAGRGWSARRWAGPVDGGDQWRAAGGDCYGQPAFRGKNACRTLGTLT